MSLIEQIEAAAKAAGGEFWSAGIGQDADGEFQIIGPIQPGGSIRDAVASAVCHVGDIESPKAAYIALANPANILRLIEAYKRVEGSLKAIEVKCCQMNSCHADQCRESASEALARAREILK